MNTILKGISLLALVLGIMLAATSLCAQSGGTVFVTLDSTPTGEVEWACDSTGSSSGVAYWNCYNTPLPAGASYDLKCSYLSTQVGESHWSCMALATQVGESHWSCVENVDPNGLDYWKCVEEF